MEDVLLAVDGEDTILHDTLPLGLLVFAHEKVGELTTCS